MSACFDQIHTVLTNSQEDKASSTVETLADAYQFARHNQFIADLAPLQLYASALVFAPDLSVIKNLFKPCMPLWLLSPPKVEGSWHGDKLKFEGHTNLIMAIAFSPNDKLLGTCSRDGTARIWDTTDANCLLTVSYDRTKYDADAIAFSSDSSKVAVAYTYSRKDAPFNFVVTIYQTKTGTLLRTTRCSELLCKRLYLAVAFEEDNHDHDAIVAVVGDVDQVRVWRSVNDSNILLRAWTSRFPRRKTLSTIDVAISQDASLICCSGVLDESGESPIRVLDSKSGAVISECKRNNAFSSMSFSGSTLVYQMGQEGDSLCLSLEGFDVHTPGPFTHLVEYHGYWCKFSLANSKDRVAFSPFCSHTVHVEKIPESKTVGRRTQGLFRRQVAVAPRGDLVADWNDGCLTMLDTKGLVTQTIIPNVDEWDMRFQGPRCLTISPDCQHIAVGFTNGIAVWNIKNGQLLPYCYIKLDQYSIKYGLVFSNDNDLAHSYEQEISLWDLESSERKLVWKVPRATSKRWHWWERLEFSADGQDLLVDHSRLHIATETWTALPELTFGGRVGLASPLSKSLGWVQFDDEDLLWIPEEQRPDYEGSAARGNTVALGQADGSVMVLTFDPSLLQSPPSPG
jgi:WD40 repeat protein